MEFKSYLPGEVFTAADANNLLSGGRLLVETASDLDTIVGFDRQAAIARDSGNTYTYVFESQYWRPDAPTTSAHGSVEVQSVTGGGSSGTTFWSYVLNVTFPAGRFVTPPIVLANTVAPSDGFIVMGASISSITATGFSVRALRAGATPTVGTVIHWQAIAS